ncbi:hypothetical protein RFI_21624 [Reticulomyxa filosa]|uniref:DH domain-containing protein n=1 Tax=Reticulomyxa filosa TaxID=46433 RepID=X6MP06_RETFI|nr:hypothetical protein RFI_21624 [Reticulomyxa filosa]|eukprot:ETO15738.1 hypothetical protein RFI_21624 [Reticulomyxa filosa]
MSSSSRSPSASTTSKHEVHEEIKENDEIIAMLEENLILSDEELQEDILTDDEEKEEPKEGKSEKKKELPLPSPRSQLRRRSTLIKKEAFAIDGSKKKASRQLLILDDDNSNSNKEVKSNEKEKEKTKEKEEEEEEEETNGNSTNKNELKRKAIVDEIISTEKNYVEGLRCLQNEFVDVFFKEGMIDPKFKHIIESNLPSLVSFHGLFYEEMESNRDNISHVFCKPETAACLKLYIQYVSNYGSALDVFASPTLRNKKTCRNI